MNKYAKQDYNNEHMARAKVKSISVSFKHCIEISSFIRGESVDKAKKILSQVIEKKKAVPFKRFNWNVGHKKRIGPGRYPIKAAKEILSLIEGVEANAQFKGLNTSNLVITHICANNASKSWHYGRKRGRRMKRTNVEIVVEEKAKEKKVEIKKKAKSKEEAVEKKIEKTPEKKEDAKDKKDDVQESKKSNKKSSEEKKDNQK